MAVITYNVYIDWDNNGSVLAGAPTTGETVTARVLNLRTGNSWSYGRDTARSLAAVKPGQVTIELDNRSKDYSPDFATSPLFGNLGPGKPVLIKATHSAIDYKLFWGFIDDYSIDPFRTAKSVTLTCMDALGKLAQTQVHTAAYESIQTGPAITAILDDAGWSASLRDLDAGSTTLRYWCADDTDAWSAIQAIVQAEGNPAIAYIGPTGNLIFRDRHHRRLDAASLTSQATFRDTGTEPLFSDPVEYNIGFRDLINTVEYTVDERAPVALGTVWSTDASYTIAAAATLELIVHTDDPFFDAVAPVVDTDYSLVSGTLTSVTLDRTSGRTVKISIVASTASYITGVRLRAFSCPVVRQFTTSSIASASVTKYGIATPDEEFAPQDLSLPDAKAIGDRIVVQRGERLPVISVTLKAANDTRKVQMLSRTISDMVTVVEAQTATNHTHYIEKIEQDIKSGGKEHWTTLGCERFLATPDDASTIFILDSAVLNHRLDSGKLAT